MSYNLVHLAVAAHTIFLVLLAIRNKYLQRYRPGHRLPPGPVGLPLLGNLLQVPRTHLATYFRRLIEEYGGIVSLNLAGFPVILIGEMKVAKELLEKHAAKHSSRPIFPYFRYHVDPTLDMWGMSEDGETHTMARKLTAGIMSTVRAGKTEQLQEFEATLNIQRLLDDGGEDWYHYMNLASASVTFSVTFGMHCPTGNEPALKTYFSILEELVHLGTPNASIINAFPFLDIIPGPMPWRTRAQAFRKRQDELYAALVDEAMTGKASNLNTWAAAFASEDKPEGDQRRLLRFLVGAAIETTAISLQTFVLACIRYPGWIATAQKEIDDVVGFDRLPTFKDRPSLPYVEAIVRETLRWRPAARFGLPHMTTANDTIEYKGQEYFIAKGSVIFGVAWAIEHDPSKYEDHDRFMPERFLDSEGKLKTDYETSAFGFGRRICLGIPFAERFLWINIAMILWTFNIRASDELDSKTGMPFQYDDSDAAFSGEIANSPFKFPAVFEPRSQQRAEVAKREWAECEKDLNMILPTPKDP